MAGEESHVVAQRLCSVIVSDIVFNPNFNLNHHFLIYSPHHMVNALI
jgi:hypothetical protein